MEHETNLRALRLRHGLQLTELSEVSWLSDQYISRAELGQIAATPGDTAGRCGGTGDPPACRRHPGYEPGSPALPGPSAGGERR